jgi:hypothetical protein
MDRFPDFGPEGRGIRFPVDRYGMLYRSVDKLILPICGDGYGAFHFTREFSAIDVFSCHGFPPDQDCCPASR